MLRVPYDVVILPPVNTVPDAQYVGANAGTPLTGFKVLSWDSPLSTTLAVEHGTLTIGAAGNVTVSGNGTGTVVLTGAVDDINAALGASDNLIYRGFDDFFGADRLTMTTSDHDRFGAGVQTDTDQVAINVGILLTGSNGDDTFDAIPAAARIDAGGGHDTIKLGFRLVDATIRHVDNTVIIDGPSSHMVLSGFERFEFTDGTVDNRDGDPLVDDLFYYARNHDVWNAHVDADEHYAQFGRHEGRDPNAWFDASGYLAAYADVAAAGVDPLAHYMTFGWREGRDPSVRFDTTDYLAANPDVAAAGVNPLLHYLQFGADEGRKAFADGLWG